MFNDDDQVGQILSRRDALKVIGIGSVAIITGCTPSIPMAAQPTSLASQPESIITAPAITHLPACVVKPALTEGPYFVDEMLNRSDIRADPSDGTVKDGIPLILKFIVSEVGSNACAPLPAAQVDVWHCDASGVYSDAQDPGFNTKGKKFLRGYQLTGSDGSALFTTIYPGWYQGRSVHIHFKIRNKGYEFTSQLFFDDSFTDQVYENMPYSRREKRSVMNAGDGIFQNGGSQLLLDVIPRNGTYSAAFDIGLQM